MPSKAWNKRKREKNRRETKELDETARASNTSDPNLPTPSSNIETGLFTLNQI